MLYTTKNPASCVRYCIECKQYIIESNIRPQTDMTNKLNYSMFIIMLVIYLYFHFQRIGALLFKSNSKEDMKNQ